MQTHLKLAVDTHCHSVASVHALTTIKEVVDISKAADLEGVVISDHHPSLQFEGEGYRVDAPDDAYFYVFCRRLNMDQESFKVYKGIELNLLDHEPWVSPIHEKYCDFFDIKLAGIHFFPHLFKKNHSAKQNTEFMVNAISSGERRPFHILTHPVIKEFPVDIESIVKACASRNIALEVNNSHLRYREDARELISNMLKWALKFKAFISVGTDAHVPNEIGDLTLATQLLSELNYPHELIINSSTERFNQFLNGNF